MGKQSRKKKQRPDHSAKPRASARQTTPQSSLPVAGLGRRLAAMVYDGLLLIAIYAVVGMILIPFATPDSSANQHQVSVLSEQFRYGVLTPTLLVVTFFFYGYFWTHARRTLGMQTWQLELHRMDGGPITWRNALVRYLWSLPSFFLFGAGYWWIWLDREGLAIHDRLSGTRIVVIPKEKKPGGRLFGMFSGDDD